MAALDVGEVLGEKRSPVPTAMRRHSEQQAATIEIENPQSRFTGWPRIIDDGETIDRACRPLSDRRIPRARAASVSTARSAVERRVREQLPRSGSAMPREASWQPALRSRRCMQAPSLIAGAGSAPDRI